MFKINSLVKVCLILLLLPITLIGQKGDIKGIVVDSKVKETLIGANVVIQGTTIGASTDLDGSFKLSVYPGTYNIEVSFISYKIKIIEKVNVTNGQVTDIGKIELEEESTTLGEVTVQERKKTDTQMALISSIKTNNVAVTGITFDQISKTQDKNAAEAIRRVPGITIMDDRFIVVRGLEPRYNTVWLNNSAAPSSESDSRAFSFDAISSSAIDRMMVYKTPAPELPADFAGAAIQLYTRNLPEKNGFNIRYKAGFRAGTSFNDFTTYEGGKFDWLGFDDGTRDLPEDFPDVAGNAELHDFSDNGLNTPAVISQKKREIERLSEEFNKIWSGSETTAPIDNALDLDYIGKFKIGENSLGNITSLIYRNDFETNEVIKSEHHDITVAADQINSYQYVPYYDYLDKEYHNNVTLGLMHNWSYQTKKGTLVEFRNLFNQLGKKTFIQRNGQKYYFDANSFQDSYEMGYQTRTMYTGQLAGKHKFNDNITLDATLGYSYANNDEPDIRRVQSNQNTDSSSRFFQQYGVVIDQQASPSYLGRLYLSTIENIWNLNTNYVHKFRIGSIQPSVKAGFYYEDKNRDFNARNIAFTKSLNFDNSLDTIIYLKPVDLMFDDQNIDSAGIWVNENTSKTDTYRADNNLIAAYAGLDLPLTQWISIYAGVRMEQNSLEIYNFKSPVTGDTTASVDSLNFFPSVNILFHLNDKNKIRLAYGKTINRPEFREIAPFQFYDFSTSTSIAGNTNLKNAYIHNVDLRYEYYPTLNEMITIGGFYKNFINPIEQRITPGSGDDKRSVFYANLVDATSIGGEIEVRSSLSNVGKLFNTKAMDKFSIVANAAYIVSQITEVPDTADSFVRDKKRAMQGQSPYIVNAGLFYENADMGLMANIVYNIVGERIVTVGDPGRPHVVEKPRNLLDFTVAKKIGTNWEVRFGIDDLLNQPVELVQRIRVSVPSENGSGEEQVDEVEKIYTSYKPGTKFSFGVSLKL